MDKFREIKNITLSSDETVDVKSLSALVLAYVGDAVYEVFIRTLLVAQGDLPVHTLHMQATTFVKAKAQSNIIHHIMPMLTEDEVTVVKRGRNAKSGTIPKNADVTEYKYATGFESLIGYLYLTNQFDRLDVIMDEIVKLYQKKV